MLLEPASVPRVKSASNFEDSLPARGVAKDRVIINVGGYRHETYLSTLRVVPDSRLAWIAENAAKQADYDTENNEYFFDRHPGIFVNVLNYYRTGKLHCPSDVCGPLFEEELLFWGIDELQMEPCCWSNYTQHREAQATLKAFEGLQKSVDESENEGTAFGVHRKVPGGTQWRKEIWSMLEKPYSSKYAQMFAFVSLIVIILSVATFCLESIPALEEKYKTLFVGIEYFYLVWFTADFLARLCTCPSIRGFLKNFMTWVDITSVIPLYINVSSSSVSEDLTFLFVLRLIRIFRLFRFFRAMSGMQVIGHTLKASARELFLLVLMLLIPMVIFSTLVFYAEKKQRVDPDFTSIPHSFWWAVITMTTVGYGDVYPKSPLGRLIGTVCACVGVLIVALPVSVIGSNFTLFYSHAQAQLRLPKKKRTPLLLGAAGALVSETTLHNEDKSDEDEDSNASPRGETLGMPRKSLRNPSITPRCRSFRREAALPPPLSRVESSTSVEMETTTPTVKKSAEELFSAQPNGSAMDLSSGLRGVSDVMLHITAPSHRRMAISHAASPPVRKPNHRRRRRGGSKPFSNRDNNGMSSLDKDGDSNYYTTTDGDSAGEGGDPAKSRTAITTQEKDKGTVVSSNESNESENKSTLGKRDDSKHEDTQSRPNSGTLVTLAGGACDSNKDFDEENTHEVPPWKSSEHLSGDNKDHNINKMSVEPRLRSKSELVAVDTPPCKRRNAVIAKGASVIPISPLARSDDRLHRSASHGPFRMSKDQLSARDSNDIGINYEGDEDKQPKTLSASKQSNSAVDKGNKEELQMCAVVRPPKRSYIQNTTRV